MSSTRFVVSPMTLRDVSQVLEIERSCYPLPWSEQQFLQELQNPISEVLLLRIEGQLAGYLCFWLIAGELQILNVATAADFRRQGVAGFLLKQALSVDSSLVTAWLEVRASNQGAIELYQQHGFIIESVRQGYYRDGEDALLMVKNYEESCG